MFLKVIIEEKNLEEVLKVKFTEDFITRAIALAGPEDDVPSNPLSYWISILSAACLQPKPSILLNSIMFGESESGSIQSFKNQQTPWKRFNVDGVAEMVDILKDSLVGQDKVYLLHGTTGEGALNLIRRGILCTWAATV